MISEFRTFEAIMQYAKRTMDAELQRKCEVIEWQGTDVTFYLQFQINYLTILQFPKKIAKIREYHKTEKDVNHVSPRYIVTTAHKGDTNFVS
jgi:hypothetical protein